MNVLWLADAPKADACICAVETDGGMWDLCLSDLLVCFFNENRLNITLINHTLISVSQRELSPSWSMRIFFIIF